MAEGPLLVGSLPAGLQRLMLSGQYYHPVQPGLLPAGLRWLQLSGRVNNSLIGSLPSSLRQLRITDRYNNEHSVFNQPLLHVFGHSQLRILRIDSRRFATPLAPLSLPLRLQLLDLSCTAYNSAFTAGVLPPSLLRLRLGAEYRTAFTADSFAPCQRLRELDLSLCHRFRHPVAGILPASLRLLRLPRKYPARRFRALPRSVCITRETVVMRY